MRSEKRPFAHVAIIGPGAIGCTFAVRLALSRCALQVTLIDYRPDRAARLSARPIRLHAPGFAGAKPGADMEARIPVRRTPSEPPDLVILATKATAAAAAARSAAAWIGKAPLVAMQNGLGVAREVAEALPGSRVITAVSYQAANVVAEGEIDHVANLVTYLGYEGLPPDAAVRAVAAMFTSAGLPAEVAADMTPRVWGKLIINAGINPVAALAGVRNGQVAARPTLRALAVAMAEEGEAVARAEGVALPYPSAAEAVVEAARQSAENRSSMLQDLAAGRTTEIDYMSGAIVRLAERHGIPAPANRAATALIKQVTPRP
jgi:2-dehydropantoate 2-reductase